MSDALDNLAREQPDETPARPSASPRQKWQLAIITAVALGLYLFMRLLPTGTNLNHMDFRLTDKNAIEFCDPANPQFIPVIAVRSPVALTLKSETPPEYKKETRFTLKMRTAGGKAIGPADLLVSHTQKLHLLIVDPTLSDYQHIHPVPGRWNGEWEFAFKPERPGVYRVFADFTPVATQRGLYAAVDFAVPGEVANVIQTVYTTTQINNLNFELVTPGRFRAGVSADLTLRIQSAGAEKKPVPLQPVMGAFAHVVAFDEQRSGFAHLHPQQTDLSQPPDLLKPELNFKVLIPQAGRYAIWAQVKLAEEEIFVPFWVDVLPGGKDDDSPSLPSEKSSEPGDKGKGGLDRSVTAIPTSRPLAG